MVWPVRHTSSAAQGIEGKSILSQSMVMMGCSRHQGHSAGNTCYLNASDYLSPTSIYGVSFERGNRDYLRRQTTYFLFPDCQHRQQRADCWRRSDRATDASDARKREVLASRGGTTFSDIASAIVYLRDLTDYPFVKALLREKLPFFPSYLSMHRSAVRNGSSRNGMYGFLPLEGDQRFKDL